MPHSHREIISNAPILLPNWARAELHLAVAGIQSFDACFTREARDRLHRAENAILTDIQFMTGDVAANHRMRAIRSKSPGELRITPDEVIDLVKLAWKEGLVIKVFDEHNLELLLEDDNLVFGFDKKRLEELSEEMDHPDVELRTYLKTGFPDSSAKTPPLCIVSPHPMKVMSRIKELNERIENEMKEGRLSNPRRVPYYLPFRTVPAHFVDREEGAIGW